MERFACGYCGTEQIVQRRGGTVSLKVISDAISRVQTGTDRTAAELALVRLRQELADFDRTIRPLPADWTKIGYDFAYLFISVAAFLLMLWFIVGQDYPAMLGVIVGWLLLGIPWAHATNTAKKRTQTFLAPIQMQRERILTQIAANKAIVEHSHGTNQNNKTPS